MVSLCQSEWNVSCSDVSEQPAGAHLLLILGLLAGRRYLSLKFVVLSKQAFEIIIRSQYFFLFCNLIDFDFSC